MGFFKWRQDGRSDTTEQRNQTIFHYPRPAPGPCILADGFFFFFFFFAFCWLEFPWWLREPAFNAVDPGSILLRREWLPTAVFLPGESHGQRSQTVSGWTQLSDFQRESHLGKGELFWVIPRLCHRCNCLLGCALFSVVSVAQSCGTVSHPMDCM